MPGARLAERCPLLNPLRAVHLGKYYPPSPGGIEGHTQTLARGQAALGADVRVLVVNHAAADGRDATFDRFTNTPDVEEMDGLVRVIRVGRLASIARLDIAPGMLHAVRQLARDQPDVWHLHAPNVTMMLAILACPQIRPLVITHHSDIVRQRFLKYAVRPIESVVYGRAARVLSDSPGYIEGSPRLQYHHAKVDVLPLGIDARIFREPTRAALGYAKQLRDEHGSPLWLCVGRLIYYKGLSVALEALCDAPGKLLIIGTGPMEGELKAKAKQLGVVDRVFFQGHATTDQLVGAYHAATAFWFPSVARSEGFGLVQVEAMASGCPVINTAIAGSGVSWVCRHEQEGLTVPVNDPSALANAAKRMLTESGLREQLITAARKRAAAEFDHRVMAERSIQFYHAVAGASR